MPNIQSGGMLIVDVAYVDTLGTQKGKAVVATKIIGRVKSKNANRLSIRPHLPDNGNDVVDIVELSDEK